MLAPDKRVKQRQRANARTRRYRKRLREGIITAPVPVTNTIIAMLIDLGWIAEAESEDRRHVGLAISRMLADAASKLQRGTAIRFFALFRPRKSTINLEIKLARAVKSMPRSNKQVSKPSNMHQGGEHIDCRCIRTILPNIARF